MLLRQDCPPPLNRLPFKRRCELALKPGNASIALSIELAMLSVPGTIRDVSVGLTLLEMHLQVTLIVGARMMRRYSKRALHVMELGAIFLEKQLGWTLHFAIHY